MTALAGALLAGVPNGEPLPVRVLQQFALESKAVRVELMTGGAEGLSTEQVGGGLDTAVMGDFDGACHQAVQVAGPSGAVVAVIAYMTAGAVDPGRTDGGQVALQGQGAVDLLAQGCVTTETFLDETGGRIDELGAQTRTEGRRVPAAAPLVQLSRVTLAASGRFQPPTGVEQLRGIALTGYGQFPERPRSADAVVSCLARKGRRHGARLRIRQRRGGQFAAHNIVRTKPDPGAFRIDGQAQPRTTQRFDAMALEATLNQGFLQPGGGVECVRHHNLVRPPRGRETTDQEGAQVGRVADRQNVRVGLRAQPLTCRGTQGGEQPGAVDFPAQAVEDGADAASGTTSGMTTLTLQAFEQASTTVGITSRRRRREGVGSAETGEPGNDAHTCRVTEPHAGHAAVRQVAGGVAQPQVEPRSCRLATDTAQVRPARMWVGEQVEIVAAGASPTEEEKTTRSDLGRHGYRGLLPLTLRRRRRTGPLDADPPNESTGIVPCGFNSEPVDQQKQEGDVAHQEEGDPSHKCLSTNHIWGTPPQSRH